MKYFLLPFSWLYAGIMCVRNLCYERKYLKTNTFNRPTISVGNLSMGGTGKTPHIEYLIRLLKNRYSVATLSRGYGRKTKGYLLANETSTAQDLGDEPLQIHQKYGQYIAVCVGEDRVMAVPHLLYDRPSTEVILLDDAYQHRAIGRHLNILLTEWNRLFINDLPIPAGRLRESKHQAKRADVLIVTKAFSAEKTIDSGTNFEGIGEQIKPYLASPDVPIFFTGLQYGGFYSLDNQLDTEVSEETVTLLVSGLANADGFEEAAGKRCKVHKHLRFADHHRYTNKDWQGILKEFENLPGSDKMMLCTEKDAAKLQTFKPQNLWVLPIEVCFWKDSGRAFDEWVLKTIEAMA